MMGHGLGDERDARHVAESSDECLHANTPGGNLPFNSRSSLGLGSSAVISASDSFLAGMAHHLRNPLKLLHRH